jgi:hypothetical protein
MRRRKLIAALAAAAVVVSAGGAYAATQSSSNPRQALLNDVAKRLNVTPAQLRAAIQGALLDRLNAAAKAGRITQAQANQMKQRIEQGGVARHGFFRGPGFGPPGLGPHGLRGPFQRPGILRPFAAAAKYLGLSDTQILNEMFNQHQSLAQIAKTHGKSVSGLESVLVGAERSRLDQLVKAGRITKAQEQQALSRLSARIDRLVNRAPLHAAPPLAAPPAGAPPAGGPGPANLAPPPTGPPPPAA